MIEIETQNLTVNKQSDLLNLPDFDEVTQNIELSDGPLKILQGGEDTPDSALDPISKFRQDDSENSITLTKRMGIVYSSVPESMFLQIVPKSIQTIVSKQNSKSDVIHHHFKNSPGKSYTSQNRDSFNNTNFENEAIRHIKTKEPSIHETEVIVQEESLELPAEERHEYEIKKGVTEQMSV